MSVEGRNHKMQYLKEVLNLKKDTQIGCIVPAWNEEQNISRVLDVVKEFSAFDEIIVVNDGSTDKTKEVIERYVHKKLKLINHEINRGKTAAVLTGIKNTKSELIVMIDADLIGLSEENIAKMVYPVLKKEYDLTILDRAGDRKAIWGWTNCARFFGGERTFWKKDFINIPLPKEGNYLLEIIMNSYYIKNNKKIKNIYCPNLYTVHQFMKFGKLKGYYNYFNMSIKIVRKATLKGFIKQFKHIEADPEYLSKFKFQYYKNNVNRYYDNIKEKMIAKNNNLKSNINKWIKS